MAAGELTSRQRAEVDRAIRAAEQVSRFEFSVFHGQARGDSRVFAERLHAAMVAPPRSVLVLLDPVARVIEVVTGSEVRRHLSDREVELAVLAMQADCADGDVTRGLVRGLGMLAEHARAPRTLHAQS